jgi:Ca-activated chloride channel homolog
MRNHQTPKKKKVRTFHLWGAIGCLAGALLGETLLSLLAPPAMAARPHVDVVFVLDVTSSMQGEINGVQRGFEGFVSGLGSRDLDARVGVVAFRDEVAGEPSQVLSFDGEPFTLDPAVFRREVGRLRAQGGGDAPESSLNALALAARQPFRPGASRVLVLITDAAPKIPDTRVPDVEAAARILQDRRIDQLHLVADDTESAAYAALQRAVPGELFSLTETAAGREGFDRILPEIGRQIALSAPSLIQSGASPRHFASVLLVTSLWTALLTLGVSLALIMSQNHFLRRPLLTLAQAWAVVGGSILIGAVAGTVGQLIFAGAANLPALQVAGKIIAWALLGALVALGMTFFVPNLARGHALLGGALGGALGAICFLAASQQFGDFAGRLIGAAILGFCIGLMIALVEFIFAQAQLGFSRIEPHRSRPYGIIRP